MKQKDKLRQSEVGMIPRDWKIVRIGEVTRINQVAINKNNAIEEIEYIDIDSVNRGCIDKAQSLNLNEAPSRARRLVKDKDIIISTVRPNLRHYAFLRNPAANTVVSTGFAVITSLEIDARFLYYYITSEEFTNYLTAIADGHTSTYPSFNPDIIERAYVPLPPMEEQRAIAHILGTLDDKIALNCRMNVTLEGIARAIFKSCFIDFDPVRAKMAGRWRKGESLPGLPAHLYDLFPDRLVDSDLGEIPEGWKVGSVDEEINLTMGQSPPGNTYNETGKGLPFYQGRADFGFRFPTRRVYCTAPTRYAKGGDTLISVRAPVGDINMASEECAIGRGVAAGRHKTGARSYCYHLMWSLKDVFSRFEAEGTVFGSIGKKDFQAITCLVPSRDLVADFEHFVSRLDSRIAANEQESRTLAVARDTLLPRLISGELRVKNAD